MAHRIDFVVLDTIVMQIGSPGVPPQVLVTWTIERIRGSHDIIFHVERSQSPDFTDLDAIEEPTGPIVFSSGQQTYEYLDITVNLQNAWRRWYYRIRAIDLEASKEYLSPVKTWESQPKVFEQEIIARHDWLLRYETGTPCFALVERTAGGGHCDECWNASLQRSTKSGCPHCFGTGRERPFFQPILTFVDFNPPTKATAMQQHELQVGQTNVWWSAFPQLKPRDILVEVLSGKRWRLIRVNPVGDNRTDIQHFSTIEQIKLRDAEYQVAVSPEVQKTVVADLERMKCERRF